MEEKKNAAREVEVWTLSRGFSAQLSSRVGSSFTRVENRPSASTNYFHQLHWIEGARWLGRGDWWIATPLLSTTVYKNVQITKCPTLPYSNQPWTHRKSSVEMGAQLFPRPTFFPPPEPKPTTRCLPTPSLLKSSGVVQSAPNRMASTMMNGAWKKKR